MFGGQEEHSRKWLAYVKALCWVRAYQVTEEIEVWTVWLEHRGREKVKCVKVNGRGGLVPW